MPGKHGIEGAAPAVARDARCGARYRPCHGRTGVRSWWRGSSGGVRSRPRARGSCGRATSRAGSGGRRDRRAGGTGAAHRSGPRPAAAGAARVRRPAPGTGAAARHHRRRRRPARGGRGDVVGAGPGGRGASQAGSWVAAVGLGSLGLVAASELGVTFEHLALVADPGRERAGWASVVAALVDGFDVVLVAAACRLRAADTRRLVARVRERGAVLVAVGGELPGEPQRPAAHRHVVALGGPGRGERAPAGPAGDRRGRGPGRGVPGAPGRAVAARSRWHGGGGRAGGRADPAAATPAGPSTGRPRPVP